MITIIHKNAKPSEVKKLMSRIKCKPPLELQREWRRDWDRLSS